METTEELNFLSTLLPFASIVFIIAIGVILLNQQFRKGLYRKQLEQEALKNQHQMELLRSNISIQEEERKRFAQNLHDELGALLSISRMHMVQLEQRHADNPNGLLPALQNVRSLTETALASMRRISHELMPLGLASMGLAKTLGSVADQANKTGEVQIIITATDETLNLPWSVELSLYRITMELINNSLKHAKAEIIRIDLETDAFGFTCQYSDNGKGLPEKGMGMGLGLKGIEGRAKALGGTLQYGNAETGGFYAQIKIPAAG